MNIFLRYILAILIFFIGFIGNSTGLIVFIRISSKTFPTRIIFIIYAFINLSCLFYTIIKFLIRNILSVLLYDLSISFCKLGYFLDFFLLSVANYILAFISMERFLSIKFSKLNTFKKKLNQFIFIFIIVTYNFLLYTPSIYFLSFVNKTNSSACDYIKKEYDNLMSLMDLINSSLMPFLIMFMFSGLLIQTVLKSRLRLLNLANQRDRIKLRKDIQLSVSLVVFNLAFLLLNAPHTIYHLVSTNANTDLHDALYFLSWCSFCIDFYILFAFNSIFRKNVLSIFHIQENRFFSSFLSITQ